jgi:hypothetical protein
LLVKLAHSATISKAVPLLSVNAIPTVLISTGNYLTAGMELGVAVVATGYSADGQLNLSSKTDNNQGFFTYDQGDQNLIISSITSG